VKLYKREPGGPYYVEFYDEDGQRYRRSTGKRDRPAALARARELAATVLSACEDVPATETLTLRKAFSRCFLGVWADVKRSRELVMLTQQIEKQDVRGVPLGEYQMRDITYDVLLDLKAELEIRGLTSGTIRNWMVPIKVTLREAQHWEVKGRPALLRMPKFPRITVKNQKDRVVSAAEEQRILERIGRENDPRWWLFKRYVVVLLDTGGRRNEVLHLTWERIDATTVTFPRYTTKNDKPRQVPLTKRAKAALMEVRNTQRTEQVGPFTELSDTWVTHRFRRACDDVGLKDVTLHTLRHTCATRLLQRGMDIYMVSKWLGHSSVVITEQRYAHVTSDDLSIGAKLLEENDGTDRRDHNRHHDGAGGSVGDGAGAALPDSAGVERLN